MLFAFSIVCLTVLATLNELTDKQSGFDVLKFCIVLLECV